MNDVGQDEEQSRPKRRIWPGLVYFAFVVAAVAAALWAHRRWIYRPQASSASVSPYQPQSPSPQDGGRGGKVSPSALAKRPWRQAGLKALKQDPCDVKPPPGSRFQSAFQRDQDGYRYQQISYRYPGEMKTAREHYAGSLNARGYQWINRAAPIGRTMVFQSGRDKVLVLLGKRASPQGDVSIGVTVARPLP